MFKLALFFTFIIFTSAKMPKKFDIDGNDWLEQSIPSPKRDNVENLWVLRFDDEFDFKELRAANRREQNVFKRFILPEINAYNENTEYNLKKNHKFSEDPELKRELTVNTKPLNKNIRNEMRRLTNKFFFSIGSFRRPVNSLNTKRTTQPSLTLYFNGPFSSLVLDSRGHKNHYLLDPESNLLPDWFYEEHKNISHDKNGEFINVPDNIKMEFYEKFINVIKQFLAFAI